MTLPSQVIQYYHPLLSLTCFYIKYMALLNVFFVLDSQRNNLKVHLVKPLFAQKPSALFQKCDGLKWWPFSLCRIVL